MRFLLSFSTSRFSGSFPFSISPARLCNNVRQGFFEPWQFDSLLSKLPDYLHPPITFAYWIGWRLDSEVLCLTWEQVDLDAGTVHLLAETTKNGEGRVIWLPDELRALFAHQ